MTDAADYENGATGKQLPDDVEIIDASKRTRPRVHGAEADEPEPVEDLSFLGDVSLRLNMVLGEATMPLGEVITLEADSIIQLEKLSGEPIDIYVENQKLGKGEVLVIHEKMRIRVLEITSPLHDTEQFEDAERVEPRKPETEGLEEE